MTTPEDRRPRAPGCPLLAASVVYGDARPLPDALVTAILTAWKRRSGT